MQLRCWPGCFAVIRKSSFGHEGKIVRCHQLAGLRYHIDGWCAGPWWVIDKPYAMNVNGQMVCEFADEDLIPLQNPDDTAQDESAKWLPPVPTTEKPKEPEHA